MEITTDLHPSSETLTRLVRRMWSALEYKRITVKAQVQEILTEVSSRLYVAKEGFAVVQQTSESTWFLLLLSIEPDCQRRGYGRALVEKVAKDGKESHASWLELGTPSSGGAVEFYEKLAPHHQEGPTYSKYYDTDMVRFAWKLNPQSTKHFFNTGIPVLTDSVPHLEKGIKAIMDEANTANAAYEVWSKQFEQQGDVSTDSLFHRAASKFNKKRHKVYAIGSLTKLFVAYAFLLLVEDKQINASDPVSDHLDLDLSPHKTTLHQMLCHRNGLPSINNEALIAPGNVLMVPDNEKEFLRIAQKSFELAKGSFRIKADGIAEDRDEYSNSNYICIAMVITRKFGLSMADIIQQHVIKPLRLGHTYVSAPKHRVPCFAVDADGKRTTVQPLDHSTNANTFAMMGMYSCVEDIVLFLKCLIMGDKPRPDLEKIFFGRCDESSVNRYYPVGIACSVNNIVGDDWSLNQFKCPSQNYPLGQLPEKLTHFAKNNIWRYEGNVYGYHSEINDRPV